MPKTINPKDSQKLCALLVAARESANLTQKQVSDIGFISQSELSKIENGARRVDFLMVIQLAKIYKKDIRFFIPEEKSTR